MNEIDQLRLELAEARNQLEKYRQLEWTCYEALGYSEPTNDALPFLISKEREDRIGLEKQLKSALDSLTRFQRQCEYMVALCKNSESR